MFTGIVEEMGEVLNIRLNNESALLNIRGKKIIEDLRAGDSIAVNGVCLTAARITSDAFYADVMPETIRRTNLQDLKIGDKVNLERALLSDGRLGGHFVSGHIDGTGVLLRERREGNAVVKTFSAPAEILHYMIVKGSVAVDGVSLTIADMDETSFQVSLIPHTIKETALFYRKQGDKVNLEADLLGKYIEKFLSPLLESKGVTPSRPDRQGLSIEFLAENGFI